MSDVNVSASASFGPPGGLPLSRDNADNAGEIRIEIQEIQAPPVVIQPVQPQGAGVDRARRNVNANRFAADVGNAARNDAGNERSSKWMVYGAGIGALIGLGISMGTAYPDYLDTLDDLSANPYKDFGDKAAAEGKLTGIVIGATAGGALVGAAVGYFAGNIADGVQRCCRWMRG